MDIAQKLNKYLSEGKEMTLKKVMDKIDDGYWEAMEDVKVGKHVTIRDTKTNKRFSVYITEDLDEGKLSLIVSAVKKDIGLSEKQFKIAHLTGNIESPKNNDKCVIVFKNNGKPKFKVYTFDSSNKWVPGEVFTDSNKLKSLWKDFPNVYYNLDESSHEEDSLDFILEADKMPLTLKIGDSFKTNEGSIKITDITVSSLHMNPITYITYKYDVVIDGKPLKGEEKASLNSFKDHFKK